VQRADVVEWLKAYMQAWESYSPQAIGDLFTEDATYWFHPFDEPVVGREAIVQAWLKEPDAPGTFTANYAPVAVEGDVAVVNGRSTYFKDSSRTEMTKEWDNLFVIEFDKAGRCRSFREWYVARRGQTD
jgi:ketosteroid isomerase-like protein